MVLAVSPDSEASHRKFKAKYKLPYTLLVDSDHAIAEAYGVWGEKSFMGKQYIGITRSHFVIDEQGLILDARVKVGAVESVGLALAALDQNAG